MDWSNETYVRLYCRDTVSWKRLRWQGQAVLMFLIRNIDRAGVMDGVEDIVLDVSIMTGLPEEIVVIGMEALLKEGIFKYDGLTLFMPNFMDAQETPKSDKQRQRESRERRRTNAFREYTPEQCHGIVNRAILNKQLTRMPCESCSSELNIEAHHDDYSRPLNVRWLCVSCHKLHHSSRNVTDESRNVTDGHDSTDVVTGGPLLSPYALPCSAVPCNTNNNTPKPPKGGRVEYPNDFLELWGKYPSRSGRKVNKKKALSEYRQAKRRVTFEVISEAIDAFAVSEKATSGYAEDMFRWLRTDPWDDEIAAPGANEASSGFDIV